MSNTRTLRVEKMGRVGYGPMLALQELRHAEVVEGKSNDTLFLLEHEPVITLGRNSGKDHIVASKDRLLASGVEVFNTGRGGDVTYHGPGQIVGYPIMRLGEGEQDVRGFVSKLEEIMIRTANDFDVAADRVEGLRGVWAGEVKVGAVGVRISRWTTMHGFALNVATGIDGFSLIVPCGLHGRRVTSLCEITGKDIDLGAVEARLAFHAAEALERIIEEAPATPVPAVPAQEIAS